MTRVTEAEARDKICPMSVAGGGSNLSCCHGSACMAWRWADDGYDHERIPEGRQAIRAGAQPVLPEGWEIDLPPGISVSMWMRRPIPPASRTGYCGLAEPKVAEVEVSHG